MQRRELVIGSLGGWLTTHALGAAEGTRTLAGTGSPGYTNDGGQAATAQINNPYGLTTGPDGAAPGPPGRTQP